MYSTYYGYHHLCELSPSLPISKRLAVVTAQSRRVFKAGAASSLFNSRIVGYGSGLNYNSGYGTGTYSSYGSGGMYGGGLYGNNMYRGGYGGLYGGGMVAILIDQNTQAFHMFMTALLQLFDRSGLLYGELAAFVLRILGVKTKPKKVHHPGAEGLPGPRNPHGNQNFIEGPKAGPTGGWDNVWVCPKARGQTNAMLLSVWSGTAILLLLPYQ
nr:peroxisomal membrane protein 13 [Ipomoea batatas]